jgi:hypothetical protein
MTETSKNEFTRGTDPERPFIVVLMELEETATEWARLEEKRRELSMEADLHVLSFSQGAYRSRIIKAGRWFPSTFYRMLEKTDHPIRVKPQQGLVLPGSQE